MAAGGHIAFLEMLIYLAFYLVEIIIKNVFIVKQLSGLQFWC